MWILICLSQKKRNYLSLSLYVTLNADSVAPKVSFERSFVS